MTIQSLFEVTAVRSPKVDARWANLALDRIERTRIPIDPILKQVGLTRMQVSDPGNRISHTAYAKLLEVAAERLEDSYFGFSLAEGVDLHKAALLGYVVLNSATFGAILHNITRYYRVLSDGLETSLTIEGDNAVYAGTIADTEALGLRQWRDFDMGLMRQLHGLTRPAVRPRYYTFRYSRPSETAIHDSILRAPVYFDQPVDSSVYPREALDLPVFGSDSELLPILQRYCQEILGRREEPHDLAYDVRSLIAKRLPMGGASMDDVARELGMGSRTLMRRLRGIGVAYNEILDDVRRQLAERYLQGAHFSIDQIAFLLGYSEAAAFVRAFKRWSGTTPGRYRASVPN